MPPNLSSLVKSGKRTAAQVVKPAITTTPRRLKRMKEVHDSSSTEEALALIVDLGKERYISMQRGQNLEELIFILPTMS